MYNLARILTSLKHKEQHSSYVKNSSDLKKVDGDKVKPSLPPYVKLALEMEGKCVGADIISVTS